MAFIKAVSTKGRDGVNISSGDVALGLHAKNEGRGRIKGLSLCVSIPRQLVEGLGWTSGETRLSVQFGTGSDHGVLLLSPDPCGVLLSIGKHSSSKPLIQKSVTHLKGIQITSDPFLSQVCGWEQEKNTLLLFPKTLTYANTAHRRTRNP